MKHLYKIQIKFFDTWNKLLPTAGQLSAASFFIAAISGVVLALAFDIKNPLQSLQIVLISNSNATFFRNLHYWSGQLFLVFALWHFYEHLFIGSEKNVPKGIWLRLVILIPIIFYIMLSGFILKDDSEAVLAKQIFNGLIETIPIWGGELRFAILGPGKDYQIIYVHHAATATIFAVLIIIEHTRRIWAEWIPLVYVLSVTVILGFIYPISLHTSFDPIVKGPWYFLGLQELLHWTANPFWVVLAGFILLIILYILPNVSKKKVSVLKYGLFLLFIFYCLLSIVGWMFREENWEFTLPF
ncbi:DUF4405 domain-containing protein [Calditrichota bacterium]